MLSALELQNFKAFGRRTQFRFAPITLIYGQNSAGKSSILNALNLLKQTRMNREQGALLLPRAERGLVDLGSFHELLHDHDPTRTLVVRVDVEESSDKVSKEKTKIHNSRVGFEVALHRRESFEDVSLEYIQSYSARNLPTLKMTPYELSDKERKNIGYLPATKYWNSRLASKNIRLAKCVEITDDKEFWTASYNEALSHRQELLPLLRALKQHSVGTTIGDNSEGTENKRSFETAIEFYTKPFSLPDFISRRRQAELGTLVALDGFVPTPLGGGIGKTLPELLALQYIERGNTSERMHDLSSAIVGAGRSLDRALEQLFPLGPFRRSPKRLYIFTGTTPLDVGYSGDLLPDFLFRKRNIISDANRWMDRLDIGYHIQIESVGTPSNDLFEVRLVDRRRSSSPSIALPDVGFGISQILPFIVQILASHRQTITIEQPEVHIHPKLQADLGDLLIAGIQANRGHQFIIETHSEHLVLRLLRRIRETSEGRLEGNPGLRPDQLSVMYLERNSEGAVVRHLRVDPNGEFIDPWPQGFFAERMKELL